MQKSTITDLIERHVFFDKEYQNGYKMTKCPKCHDYKSRFGVKNSGNIIHIQCWNCGLSTVYDEDSNEMSDKFLSTLKALGIAEDDVKEIVYGNMFKIKNEPEVISLSTLQQNKKKSETECIEVALPFGSFKVSKDDPRCEDVIKYLKQRRVFLPYIDYYITNSSNEKYLGRVIIPFYKNNKIIFWQARDFTGESEPRYLNCNAPKDPIIFGYNELRKRSNAPLFVTEGIFDAISVNGISILGSKLNETKKEILHTSKRRLVFVIDRDKNGKRLAENVLKEGWEISFSPLGHDDINRSVQKAGFIWTSFELMRNIRSGKAAELELAKIRK